MKQFGVVLLIALLLLVGCQVTEKEIKTENETMNEAITVVEEEKDDEVNENNDLPKQVGDWELVWYDEFDGDSINMDNWSYDVPTNGRWNGEIQSYTNQNAFIENGAMVLEAREETIVEDNGQSFNYSSAKLITKGKQKWTYGRIEVRAKLPSGKGIWPAIWMMPEDEPYYGTWPVCGEIDIMEFLGHQTDEIHGTIHFGEPHKQIQGTYMIPEGRSFTEEYHTYTIEWQPGKIDWFVDDVHYHTASDWFSKNPQNSETYPYPAPFDQDFFLIMNISVGGGWPGNPDETTQFPQQMHIDYVRVYQKDAYEVFEKPVKVQLPAREALADGNLVYNGQFNEGNFIVKGTEGQSQVEDEWTFFQGPAGVSTFEVNEGILKVLIDNGGETDYSVQVFQTPIHLEEGAQYKVTFDVKASQQRTIKVKVGSDGDNGWLDYANEAPMTVETEWETKSFEFLMNNFTDVKARLEFNLGLSQEDVWIRNVSLVKVK